MLQGVVDLATEATGCHACFIYLLEGDRLTIRAASPVFADAVGNVQMRRRGRADRVGRAAPHPGVHPRPSDGRPADEVHPAAAGGALPVDGRGPDPGPRGRHDRGDRAAHPSAARVPRGHPETALAHRLADQRGDRERPAVRPAAPPGRRADRACRDWPRTLPRPATPRRRPDRHARDPQRCSAPRSASCTGCERRRAPSSRCWPAIPEIDAATRRCRPPGCCWRRSTAAPRTRRPQPVARAGRGRPAGGAADGRRRAGRAAVRGRSARRAFSGEDTEMARAIAHLAAIAIKRAELIEGLTNANIVKDLFEALAAGATSFAAAKAAEVRCDLTGPYLMVCAEPAGGPRAGLGRVAGVRRGARPRARRAGPARGDRRRARAGPRAAGAGHAPPAAGRAAAARVPRAGGARRRGDRHQRAARSPADADPRLPRGARRRHDRPGAARRRRRDRLLAGRRLPLSGAHRRRGRAARPHAPAVDRLIEYDRRRRTALLDTLERYLAERRSVIESARALFIHPNTLRQRLGRIEELTGLALDEDDLLSLELAIKLARLHGRPIAAVNRRRRGTPGALGPPADPLGLLGPQQIADEPVAVGVGGHHDRLAVLEPGLLEDPLGGLARAEHVARRRRIPGARGA